MHIHIHFSDFTESLYETLASTSTHEIPVCILTYIKYRGFWVTRTPVL